MKRRSLVSQLGLLALMACGRGERRDLGAGPDNWVVDAEASVRLGRVGDSIAFGQVVGATRLPNGNILVADLDAAPFTFHLFSPNGRLVKNFGHLGGGPGEIVEGAFRLLRCGDMLAAFDYDPGTYSTFTTEGTFVRRAPINGPNGQTPAQSSCNAMGDIASYGWPQFPVHPVTGVSRDSVPLWLRRAGAETPVDLGMIAGSERWGDAPYPLGKETAIAMGDDRLYVGVGDQYEIIVLDFHGRPLGTIQKHAPPRHTTSADIRNFRERFLATMPTALQPSERRRLDTMAFPVQLPAYRGLLIDHSQNLWVEDYPRAGTMQTRWSVFDRERREIASALTPPFLDVLEIGDDYVLGLYIDPDEAIPEVRLYHLTRRERSDHRP